MVKIANLIFGLLASPGTHRHLIKDVNKWKYDIEGRHFKGKQAPFISELKFYEVRIPDEIKGDFIRDLGLSQFGMGTTESLKVRLFMKLYRIALKLFTPFSPFKASGGKNQYSIGKGTWHYVLPVGELKRKKMEVNGGPKREVL